MEILGIDIGGSGMKAAVVNSQTGEWLTPRYRIETPHPAKYDHMLAALKDIQAHFSWQGPVGCGFPGVIREQRIQTAANLHKSLVDKKLGKEVAELFGQPAWLINDADAAGMAEVRFGLPKGQAGVVLFLTIGTGIGTAFFTDGKLVPNSEFGHMIMSTGKDKFAEAEHYAADSIRCREKLKWSEWAKRFNEFLNAIYALTQPDLIVVGGGVAKKGEKFMNHLKPPCPLSLATLQNRAGITGAALAAAEQAV
ncbi:polyphosphate--glucose phosphotransferase [Cerasicoccus arenae]|uniref:Polyphosphate glucokinase n=1 Tax=Cerasicoccus arenae TaxID=424488 RepID=A0A8J3DCM5_9BACT|nr:ROK family protein [Cerasicoccus arenae]MBK1856943.1 ROK family protein [Cerasicoccus arenae]GHB89965.1 polyphosphate glucokinase [Cerasicoccus arenae]